MSILEFVDWLNTFLWKQGAFCYSFLLIAVLAPLYTCVLWCIFFQLGTANSMLI